MIADPSVECGKCFYDEHTPLAYDYFCSYDHYLQVALAVCATGFLHLPTAAGG